MTCQILFSGENKKSILECRLLKVLSSMLSAKNSAVLSIGLFISTSNNLFAK